MRKKQEPELGSFEAKYPHISEWVLGGGWVELGRTDSTNTFARALDEGGMIWEGEASYQTMDEALQALDDGIKEWLDENG